MNKKKRNVNKKHRKNQFRLQKILKLSLKKRKAKVIKKEPKVKSQIEAVEEVKTTKAKTPTKKV